MMKVLLIDPATRSVTEIEINNNSDAIYKAMDCSMFECPVEFPNRDVMYCDEEGKLNRDKLIGGFTFPEAWNDIIMNKALVVGTTPNGNSTSCKTKIADVLKAWGGIAWVTKESANRYLDDKGF